MTIWTLLPLLAAAFAASVSPGPATLALLATGAAEGRRAALTLASGITIGSLTWSAAAALGLAAVIASHGTLLEAMRYLGAAYLAFLAYSSARRALRHTAATVPSPARGAVFRRGLFLHLTNPKAFLFFGALYAVLVPAGTGPGALAVVFFAVGLQSALIFHGLALLFSLPRVALIYQRARRGLEAAFALAFAGASLRLLAARL